MEQDTFANRLNKALIIRNMKPIELAKKSAINKATISEYLSGKYEAKQNNVFKISKALNINEAWLLGYDVSIDRIPDSDRTNLITYMPIDSSMAPLLDIDDVAYISPQNTYQSGDTIYFKLYNQNLIRKILVFDEYIELKAMNPYFPVLKYTKKELKEKNFEVLGKVIKVENKSAFK